MWKSEPPSLPFTIPPEFQNKLWGVAPPFPRFLREGGDCDFRSCLSRILCQPFEIDHVATAVAIMMPDPCHGMRQRILVASLRCHIEEVVRGNQNVEPTRIS